MQKRRIGGSVKWLQRWQTLTKRGVERSANCWPSLTKEGRGGGVETAQNMADITCEHSLSPYPTPGQTNLSGHSWELTPVLQKTLPRNLHKDGQEVQCTAVHCRAVKWSAMQCRAGQCSEVQCIAVHCSVNSSDWLNLSKRGGKEVVFRGLAGLLRGISQGYSARDVLRSSPASLRKTPSFSTYLPFRISPPKMQRQFCIWPS